MIGALRKKVGSWISPKRAAPIVMTPEYSMVNYGPGLASAQPSTSDLLRQSKGVADIATRAIANRIASLVPLVYASTQTSEGTLEDEQLDDHVLKMLIDRPHPDFTRQQLLRLTAQWIVSCGDAYWLKINNGFGVPTMLQPISPKNVEVEMKGGFIAGYTVTDGRGSQQFIEAREMIRFWLPDPETVYTGEGYLGPNAVVHDAQSFAQEHLRNRYQNDATPHMILKGGADAVPPTDPQWERWLRDWQRKHDSLDGTHKGLPAMTPPGWDPIFAVMAGGADITPLLEFWQSNQLMNFGVPSSILGRVISGDRSSAETNQYVFDKHTILPISSMIQEALTLQLAPDFDEALWVEFEDFISDDKDFELRREAQDLALKVRSVKQVLQVRGEDPEDAPWGEYPVGTLADQPYYGEAVDLPDPSVPDDADALFEPEDDAEEEVPEDTEKSVSGAGATPRVARSPQLASDANTRAGYFTPAAEWERVKRREMTWRPKMDREIRRIFEMQRKEAIKKLNAIGRTERATIKVEKIFNAEKWAKEFFKHVDPIRRAAFIEAANEAAQGIGSGAFVTTDKVIESLEKNSLRLVSDTGMTTKRRLAKAISEGLKNGESTSKIAKRIDKVFSGRRSNSATIARTEIHRATQEAQMEAYEQSGVVEMREWNDFGDDKVRDAHLAAYIEPAEMGDPFILTNGALAMFPCDPSLDPEDSINCRCYVLPIFVDT